MNEYVDISALLGKTLTDIERTWDDGEETVIFTTSEGEKYLMFHSQDCCEDVRIEEIVGDELSSLIGNVINIAESVSNPLEEGSEYYAESGTWTFYRLGTMKAYCTIRWLGTSNGYYSERVTIMRIK